MTSISNISRRAAMAAALAAPAAMAGDTRSAKAARRPALSSPDALPPSVGFSHIADTRGGRIVYISGQVPRDASGALVGPGNFRLQVEQVFRNLDIAVRAAGGTFHDIVKLNYYCIQPKELTETRAIPEVRDRYVNTASPPASTYIFVPRLVSADWLVEIEAVAVIPESASMDETKVGVQAQLDFAPEHAEEGGKALAALAVATRQEPGCISYLPMQDLDVAGRYHLTERWQNEEALRAHFKTPHMAEFQARVSGKMKVVAAKRFDISGTEDLFPRRS